jgi:hypothetical protein
MSETTGTVIKLLSALTSPKASVKYISMAIFLVISWRFLNEKLVSYGAPTEHLSLVVLLIGLGAGSLVGQVIYSIVEYAWSSIEKRMKGRKEKKAKAEIDAATSQAVSKANDEFLGKFKSVYEYYPYWKKDALRRLVKERQRLESDLDYVHTLEINRYIIKIANIDSESDMYEINPVIRDYVHQHWQQEIERNVSEFFDDLTPEKQDLLRVMTFMEDEFSGPIGMATVQLVKPLHPCFEIECESELGFFITFRYPYHIHFTDRTGADLNGEVYIRHEWIH